MKLTFIRRRRRRSVIAVQNLSRSSWKAFPRIFELRCSITYIASSCAINSIGLETCTDQQSKRSQGHLSALARCGHAPAALRHPDLPPSFPCCSGAVALCQRLGAPARHSAESADVGSLLLPLRPPLPLQAHRVRVSRQAIPQQARPRATQREGVQSILPFLRSRSVENLLCYHYFRLLTRCTRRFRVSHPYMCIGSTPPLCWSCSIRNHGMDVLCTVGNECRESLLVRSVQSAHGLHLAR